MSTLPQRLAAAGNWLWSEFASLWPVFLFFLVAFMIQLLIIKLAVEQFSVQLTAFSKAIVGALLAAKAVLTLNETPLARKLELLLVYIERFLEALHRVGTFDGASRRVIT